MENENYKKDRLVSIQNQILSMLQNEFSGDFNTIHVFDVENEENACISLHFTKVDFTSNPITLNRFYNICNTINEQNIEIISVDIIQSIDFEKKEIDFGFIISDITE